MLNGKLILDFHSLLILQKVDIILKGISIDTFRFHMLDALIPLPFHCIIKRVHRQESFLQLDHFCLGLFLWVFLSLWNVPTFNVSGKHRHVLVFCRRYWNYLSHFLLVQSHVNIGLELGYLCCHYTFHFLVVFFLLLLPLFYDPLDIFHFLWQKTLLLYPFLLEINVVVE